MGHDDRPGAQALQFSTAKRLVFVPSTFFQGTHGGADRSPPLMYPLVMYRLLCPDFWTSLPTHWFDRR